MTHFKISLLLSVKKENGFQADAGMKNPFSQKGAILKHLISLSSGRSLPADLKLSTCIIPLIPGPADLYFRTLKAQTHGVGSLTLKTACRKQNSAA